jgi:hypoxanthine phosphoribosyltransferase
LNSETGMTSPVATEGKVVISTEQIQKRLREMARQISHDYHGHTVYAVCVLENGFMFMADLVRALETPVVCQFIKPEQRETDSGKVEIFFSPEVQVSGGHVLLVETLVQSGVTSEFLMRNMVARGAVSVKLVTLLDKQAARRIELQPDYFGFLIDDSYVYGYGLGSPDLGRNLPYITAPAQKVAEAKP